MAAAPLSSVDSERCSEWLGLKTALVFLSTRAARSGPRVIIPIAALLISAFVLTHLFFPYRLQEALDYGQVIDWAKGDDRIAKGDGGLRIVVFGESDVATPPHAARSMSYGKSWAEHLCDELGCSSLHSFVPQTDKDLARSIVSNGLYDRALKKLMARTSDSTQAGMNYTFLERYYSPPSHLADLQSQISQFLAMKQPEVIPSQTIYVFSLGMWDIWNLAGFPLDAAYEAVEDGVRNVFSQVEDLYRESRNPESVAFSASIDNTTQVIEEQDTFRIIVPRLFDPSLAPGWKSRVMPPRPHSHSEHLKNSAYLTLKWNQEMSKRVQEWMSKGDAPHLISRNPEGAAASLEKSRPSKPPLRDALVPDMASYLVDSMIDSQLKYSGAHDNTPGSDLGKKPDEESFDDAGSACLSFNDVISDQFKTSTSEEAEACSEHLFLSDYTVTQRAIEWIGAMTADLVENNRSVRLEWENGRRGANVWTGLVGTSKPKGKGANAKMFSVRE